MTTTPSDSPRAAPAWKPLDARQRRVLGVLIEKAMTTPAGYPMTVNAIVTGCNQKSNREPVTAYDDIDVENTLGELIKLGVVSEIDWLGRAPKYKHSAFEWLGVSKVELAVIAELLLRGAQTPGELRGRAARMEPIADLAALKPVVDALLERGLMVELTPSGRGQLVSHNLHTAHERAELKSRFSGRASGATPAHLHRDPSRVPASTGSPAPPTTPAPGPPGENAAELSAEVTELRADVARLAERIRALEARLDDTRG